MKFSASLGFLWTDRPLVEAVRAAKSAGFDAVECHWPFDIPATRIEAALAKAGLPMLCLNTRPGNPDAGEFGLAALPDRAAEARAAIDEALAYARATDTGAVHVMAGKCNGATAHAAFCENLAYACEAAATNSINILIEPLNSRDVPGYFLQTTSQAETIIRDVGLPNLRLMFDCYHIQIMEGDVMRRLAALMPLIGHIQIASVPDRGAPDHGELDYRFVLSEIEALGYDRPIGAEYRPDGNTDDSLGWLREH